MRSNNYLQKKLNYILTTIGFSSFNCYALVQIFKAALPNINTLGYLLLPVMFIFALNPGLVYGGEVYTGGAKAANNNSTIIKKELNIQHLDRAAVIAEAINKSNNPGESGEGSSDKASPSTSSASNYTMGIENTINPQTGQPSPCFSPVKLQGISSGTGIDFSICYIGGNKSYFGLPAGFKFNIPFVDTDARRVYLKSDANYSIDPDSSRKGFKSGLRYSINKATTFRKITSSDNVPKYCQNLHCQYIASDITGSNYYFDAYGKLVCYDDRFQNHVLLDYQTINLSSPASVTNVKLTKITNSNGISVTISYADTSNDLSYNEITINKPDGTQIKSTFSGENNRNITVQDLAYDNKAGEIMPLRTSHIYRDANGHVSKIVYPTGAALVYNYSNSILYKANGQTLPFQAISSVQEYNGDPDNGGTLVMTTQYKYDSDNGHSFTGYPSYEYDPSKDNLMEKGNNSYEYQTTITTIPADSCNSGSVKTTQTYNFLHLPLETLIQPANPGLQGKNNNDGDPAVKIDTVTQYTGDKPESGEIHNFPSYNSLPCNYNMPAHVKTTATTEQGKTRTKTVDTDYNDYGQQNNVKTYHDGNCVCESNTSYWSNNGDETKYFGQVKSQTVTDHVDNTSEHTVNTLGDTQTAKNAFISESVNTHTSPDSNNDQADIPKTPDSKENSITIDKYGRPLTQTLKWANNSQENSSNGTTSAKTVTTYDKLDNNILKITNADSIGNKTSKEINLANGFAVQETDANGNVTKYQYDDGGLKEKTIYPDGSWKEADDILKTDSKGTPEHYICKTDSSGYNEKDYLDPLGRGVTKVEDNQGPGHSKRTVLRKFYNSIGQVDHATDIYGHITDYTYDWQGRILSKTLRFSNDAAPAVITTYSYTDIISDKNSKNDSSTSDAVSKAIVSINGVKAYENDYNDNGKIIDQVDFLSGTDNTNCLTTDKYNGKGQKLNETLQLTSVNSNSTDASDLMKEDTTYDINGKSDTVKLHANNISDNNNAVSDDYCDGTSTFQRDLFGNLIQRATNYNHLAKNVEVQQGSNDAQILSEKNHYNNIGELIELHNQIGQKISYTYDPNENKTSMTDFAGNTFHYTYDNMNRPVTMTYKDKDGHQHVKTYTYWPVSSGARQGKIKSLNLDDDTISYDYDDLGRLSQVTYPNTAKPLKITYDQYDDVTSVSDFAGEKTTCEYSYSNSTEPVITKVKNDFGSVTYTYYNKETGGKLFGDGTTLAKAQYSNGIEVDYIYYNMSPANGSSKSPVKAPKLKNIITRSSNGKILDNTYYHYNNQDQLDEIVKRSDLNPNDLNANNTQHIYYNAISEVIKTVTTPNGNSNKTLDSNSTVFNPNGDILKSLSSTGKNSTDDNISFTYDAADRIMTVTKNGKTAKINYDANGNMLNDPNGNTYTYNALNQLFEVTCNDPENPTFNSCKIGYSYWPDGLRKSKYIINPDGSESKTDCITFYYYPKNEVVLNESQTIDNDTWMSSYLIAGGKRIARDLSDSSDFQQQNATYYIANGKDILGTTDSSGTKQNQKHQYQYSPYGKHVDYNKSL